MEKKKIRRVNMTWRDILNDDPGSFFNKFFPSDSDCAQMPLEITISEKYYPRGDMAYFIGRIASLASRQKEADLTVKIVGHHEFRNAVEKLKETRLLFSHWLKIELVDKTPDGMRAERAREELRQYFLDIDKFKSEIIKFYDDIWKAIPDELKSRARQLYQTDDELSKREFIKYGSGEAARIDIKYRDAHDIACGVIQMMEAIRGLPDKDVEVGARIR